MTCPSCSSQLLFGSQDCGCGWSKGAAERIGIEGTYWETLAIFWRIYWTSALFVLGIYILGVIALIVTKGQDEANLLLNQPVFQFVAQQILTAAALYLFVPFMLRRRYRRFHLAIVTNEGIIPKLNSTQRFQVSLFLLWRWIVAGVVAGFAVAPIAIFVSLFGVSLAGSIVILAMIFGAGPLLIRFLIGHQFPDFRLEIQRKNSQSAETVPEASV